MLDNKANTYTDDYPIFEELGLKPFKGLDTHKRHFVGSYKRPDELVKIYVEPYPAQFWIFKIYSNDTGKIIKEFSTGSGLLKDYWSIIEKLLDGMIIITNYKERD